MSDEAKQDQTEVEKIKAVAKAGDDLEQGYKGILSIASSGVTTNIIRLVLYVFMGIGWIFVKRALIKQQIEQAKKLSEAEKLELRNYLASIQNRNADDMVTKLENGF